MKKSEALVAAKALIATPEQFTAGAWARDAKGSVVSDLYGDKAVKFDAIGAINRITDRSKGVFDFRAQGDIKGFLARAIQEMSHPGQFKTMTDTIVEFNDACKHDQMMAAFDAAIAKAKEQE